MWRISGTPVHLEHFKLLQPVHTLYDFDGPKTFTFLDQTGNLHLAHWCDEDEKIVRYSVVPIESDGVRQLESGKLTLLQILEQPSLMIVDVDHDGIVVNAVLVDPANIPEDVLPKAGTKLSASLENDDNM